VRRNGESFFFHKSAIKRRLLFLRGCRKNRRARLFICVYFPEREASPHHCAFHLGARGHDAFGTIFLYVKRCRKGGISEAFVAKAAETRALPFYKRSRCSSTLETATRVDLRSRKSTQKVAHFRCQSQQIRFIFYFRMEAKLINFLWLCRP